MHSRMFCEMSLDFALRPMGPLLVKSGDEDALDPTLPDMQFVRTHDPASGSMTVFIPGSSLKGVVRSHAERLVRSQVPFAACDPLQRAGRVPTGMRASCSRGGPQGRTRNTHKQSGEEAYRSLCYTCRIFGSTAVASRVLLSDLMPDETVRPIMGQRKSVAIDRITGGVVAGAGPFEMEVVEDAVFHGHLTMTNFTIGQLGLLGGTLLDISDGLVPIGFGKSKGFGRVTLQFQSLRLRYPVSTGGHVWGIGNIAERNVIDAYGLGVLAGQDSLSTPSGNEHRRGLYAVLFETDGEIREALENAVNRWPDEVASLSWSGGNNSG